MHWRHSSHGGGHRARGCAALNGAQADLRPRRHGGAFVECWRRNPSCRPLQAVGASRGCRSRASFSKLPQLPPGVHHYTSPSIVTAPRHIGATTATLQCLWRCGTPNPGCRLNRPGSIPGTGPWLRLGAARSSYAHGTRQTSTQQAIMAVSSGRRPAAPWPTRLARQVRADATRAMGCKRITADLIAASLRFPLADILFSSFPQPPDTCSGFSGRRADLLRTCLRPPVFQAHFQTLLCTAWRKPG